MTRTARLAGLAVITGMAVLLTAAGLPASADRRVPASYIFRTLDNGNDSTFNQLLGINNHDKIVGYYGSGVHGHPNKGYVLVPPYGVSSYRLENYPGSAQTEVTGLNDTGVSVGFYSRSNKPNPSQNAYLGFYLKNGRYHPVAFPTGNNSVPAFNELLGVNNSGLAVGNFTDSVGLSHGYLFNINTHKYARIIVSGATSLTATAINAGGSVVGYYTNTSGKVVSFLLKPSGLLFTIARTGADMTQAYGISKSGEVVGAYTIGNSTFGFTWHAGGTFRMVSDPNGKGSTVINGVNNDGDLVGFYTDSLGNTNGLLAIP